VDRILVHGGSVASYMTQPKWIKNYVNPDIEPTDAEIEEAMQWLSKNVGFMKAMKYITSEYVNDYDACLPKLHLRPDDLPPQIYG